MISDFDLIEAQDEVPPEQLGGIYGDEGEGLKLDSIELKRKFLPWHRPVKQIVRNAQWAKLAERLVIDSKLTTLRYLTLPGADMFDVRVIAEVCAQSGCKVEYLGFDSSRSEVDLAVENGLAGETVQRDTAESVLRQAELVTGASVTLNDLLEDIVVPGSQARSILRNFGQFDIVNIDACDHLAFEPAGDRPSLFGAIRELFDHQRGRHGPWLLYVTTRVSPDRMGGPKDEFVEAIRRNLQLPTDVFRDAFAEAMGVRVDELDEIVVNGWAVHDDRLLKLFSIGLGKYLLQLAHGQYGDPAKVELASCYCYRVFETSADMLALAFRIVPGPKRGARPTIGGNQLDLPLLEPALAAKVAKKALRLVDLDLALTSEDGLAQSALDSSIRLLEIANYDVDEYRKWLNENERPAPPRVDVVQLTMVGDSVNAQSTA